MFNVLELIELIYSAGIEPANWEDVVERLGSFYPYAAIAFQTADFRGRPRTYYHAANFEPGALDVYVARFLRDSPWIKVHQMASVGVPYSTEETCPVSTIKNTEFYSEWVKPYKVGGAGTAVKIFEEPDRFATLSTNYDSQLYDHVGAPIHRLLGKLSPHLQRAIEINRLLADADTARRSLEGLVDGLACPAFLLREDRSVACMNKPANDALAQKRGLSLVRGERLQLYDRADTSKMNELVSKTAHLSQGSHAHARGMLNFRVPGESPPNIIFVMPLVSAPDQNILKFFTDPHRHVLATVHYRRDNIANAEDRVRQALNLTAAEAKLVLALAHGTSVKDYADEANRSIHTVRMHLKSVLSKTDCHSQAELLRILHKTILQPV